jgi:hypothetical protein
MLARIIACVNNYKASLNRKKQTGKEIDPADKDQE